MLYAPMTIEQAEVAYQRMQAVKAAYPGVVPSYSWMAA